MKAQDPISNNNNYGAYTGGNQNANQNVIINNDPASTIPFPVPNNQITAPARVNFLGGINNRIQNTSSATEASGNLLYGRGNLIDIGPVANSSALGINNTLEGACSGCIALGSGNEISGVQNGLSFGINSLNSHDESILIGFGANSSNPLSSIGNRSISLGTNNNSNNTAFNTLNIRPPSISAANKFDAPVTGIGTTSPSAKLEIKNKGGGNNTAQALSVLNSSGNPLFNVREDGYAGFNVSATGTCPGNPRAPYHFRPTETTPFFDNSCNPTSGGKANIVQEYSNFPSFKDAGPNFDGQSAKWLALGERPPGDGNTQVAYGLANVWDNNAGNFVLLEEDPQDSDDEAVKDLAITFQDVGPNGGLTDDAGRNRIRFLFRNSQPIEGNPNTPANDEAIYELMSLEPTGEVAVGDYSDNNLDPEATRFEVKWNDNTDCSNTSVDCDPSSGGYDPKTILEVLRDGSATSRGNEVLTVNDAGFVGINNSSPARELVVEGKQYINTNSGFSGSSGEDIIVNGGGYTNNGMWQSSDIRLKTDTQVLSNPLSKIKKISGYTFRYADNKFTEGINTAKNRQAGIIAQQLKSVLPEAVRKGKNGIYAVNYDAIIPLLIEANKSQQDKINELQEKAQQVEKLEKQVGELQMQMQELTEQSLSGANQFEKSNEKNLNQKTVSIEEGENKGQAMLLQNRPNPYSGETIIPYFLPQDFNNANMLITNTNGQIIKRINLEKSGKGELTLRTEGLNSGQYLYSLIVDGRKIQTLKMIVNR